MKTIHKVTYIMLMLMAAITVNAAGAGGAGGADGDDFVPLVRAAVSGDRDAVISALSELEGDNELDLNLALVRAAECGHTHLLETLIKAGADINTSIFVPLVSATIAGKVDTVKWLLDAGADIAMMDSQNTTAAYRAAIGESADMVRLFLERDPDRICSSIVDAAEAGRTENVKILLDARTNPDTRDRITRTGLIAAAQAVSPDIIRLFLNAGAKVDATDSRGRTALMYLANYSRKPVERLEAARLLLEAGASITRCDKWGKTAVDFRMDESDYKRLFRDINDNFRPFQDLIESFRPWARRRAAVLGRHV